MTNIEEIFSFLKYGLTHYVFSVVYSFMTMFDTKRMTHFMNFLNGDDEVIVDSDKEE